MTKKEFRKKGNESEKTCKNCGKTFPLADWRLTMGFDFIWKCECPACKKISVGL